MKNSENFDALFQKAYAKARKVAYHFTTDSYLIDDMVQGFAVKVLANPEKYAPALSYGSQCNYGTILNLLRNEFKRYTRPTTFNADIEYAQPGSVENCAVYALQSADLENLLPQLVRPNGRKDCVLSLEKQKMILKAYRTRKYTTRELSAAFKISTATLNSFVKSGLRAPKRPKAIEYFELSRLGYTVDEIATHFQANPPNVSQQLYKVREILRTKYQSEIF